MKPIYWISTSLLAMILLASATAYLFHRGTIDGVRALGFPDFFRVQLAVLKLLAVAVLLVPAIPMQLKGWAYAGVGLFFVTSIVAHVAHDDSWTLTVINALFLALLVVSNVYLHKVT